MKVSLCVLRNKKSMSSQNTVFLYKLFCLKKTLGKKSSTFNETYMRFGTIHLCHYCTCSLFFCRQNIHKIFSFLQLLLTFNLYFDKFVPFHLTFSENFFTFAALALNFHDNMKIQLLPEKVKNCRNKYFFKKGNP